MTCSTIYMKLAICMKKFKLSESIASCFKQLVLTFSCKQIQVSSKSVLKWLSYNGFCSGNCVILLFIILHYETGFLVTAAPLRTSWHRSKTAISNTTRRPRLRWLVLHTYWNKFRPVKSGVLAITGARQVTCMWAYMANRPLSMTFELCATWYHAHA